MPTNKFNIGQVREIPKDAAESRIIPFVLSTPSKDRHSTVLNQNGWDLKNYSLNPIVGYQHNLFGDFCNPPDPDNVIGKSLDTGINTIDGILCLTASCEFEPADINPNAEKIFRKVLFGSLSRCSVGFIEKGTGHYGDGEEARDAANETYYYEAQELLEWSLVHIPSNAGAGARKVSGLRDHAYGALMYMAKELGKNLRLSQIEEMRICDVLDLLEGKDLGINTGDVEKARKAIMDERERARRVMGIR